MIKLIIKAIVNRISKQKKTELSVLNLLISKKHNYITFFDFDLVGIHDATGSPLVFIIWNGFQFNDLWTTVHLILLHIIVNNE